MEIKHQHISIIIILGLILSCGGDKPTTPEQTFPEITYTPGEYYGDVLGYQQSGIKEFKIADPIKHSDLFEIAEENIKKMQNTNENIDKYNVLLNLFDKSSLINEINF